MPECIFCKIVRGDLPSIKVYENESTLAFLDINPVNIGHTLVIPKQHSPDVFEIPESEWTAVMNTVKVISHALEKSLHPAGVNLAMNNRSAAGQVVFHAHVHIIPRYPNDGHELWHGSAYPEGQGLEIGERIRAAL